MRERERERERERARQISEYGFQLSNITRCTCNILVYKEFKKWTKGTSNYKHVDNLHS